MAAPDKHLQAAPSADLTRLRRVLSLWGLIPYGIVTVTPSAPVTVFGPELVMSKNHAVDTILLSTIGECG